MRAPLSIGALTTLHAAMGATLGAIACIGSVALEQFGVRSIFGSLAEPVTIIAVAAAVASWMAVGAGLSGFILINIERAP